MKRPTYVSPPSRRAFGRLATQSRSAGRPPPLASLQHPQDGAHGGGLERRPHNRDGKGRWAVCGEEKRTLECFAAPWGRLKVLCASRWVTAVNCGWRKLKNLRLFICLVLLGVHAAAVLALDVDCCYFAIKGPQLASR